MSSAPSGDHDVLIVGSGAGGGMAAWVLAKAGVKVLMLEAGRDYDVEAETPMFGWNKDAPLLLLAPAQLVVDVHRLSDESGVWHAPPIARGLVGPPKAKPAARPLRHHCGWAGGGD